MTKLQILREWCYVEYPRKYGIAPCSCGNENTQWSEFKDHLWCDKCNIDFIPEHWGILDGPIPFYTATKLFKISFDRYNIQTGKISHLVENNGELKYE